MVEGCIANESLFFMFEFMKQMHVHSPFMWDGDCDKERLEVGGGGGGGGI